MPGDPRGADIVAIAQPDGDGNSLCQRHSVHHCHAKPHGSTQRNRTAESERHANPGGQRDADCDADSYPVAGHSHGFYNGHCKRCPVIDHDAESVAVAPSEGDCDRYAHRNTHRNDDPDSDADLNPHSHAFGVANGHHVCNTLRQRIAVADSYPNCDRLALRNHDGSGDTDSEQHANASVVIHCHQLSDNFCQPSPAGDRDRNEHVQRDQYGNTDTDCYTNVNAIDERHGHALINRNGEPFAVGHRHPHGIADIHGQRDTDQHIHGAEHGNRVANRHGQLLSVAVPNPDRQPDADAVGEHDQQPERDLDRYADAEPHSNTDVHCNSNRIADTDSNSVAHSDRDAHVIADAVGDRNGGADGCLR